MGDRITERKCILRDEAARAEMLFDIFETTINKYEYMYT